MEGRLRPRAGRSAEGTQATARARGHKLALQPELQGYVEERLLMGWSPEQIAGRLKQEHGHCIISHEAIYRFIYHRCSNKKYDWSSLLARKRVKRKVRKEYGWKPEEKIRHRVPIAMRPEYINSRSCAGHWEADTMMFRNPAHVILVACERTSRLLKITPQKGRNAETTIANLQAFFAPLPPSMRQSLTLDNGAEFTHHHRLNHQHGISTFFCNPHSPWQKGSVENAIGRLRRNLPRKTDIAALEHAELASLVNRYNETPRKCLGFLTPNEVSLYPNSTVALQA